MTADIVHRFTALREYSRGQPLIAVDLGYSPKKTTGLTWSNRGAATNHSFSDALILSAEFINGSSSAAPILVIEAPLSCRHDSKGNPVARGSFEKGRNWYCQPGAITCLAACRFLKELSRLTHGFSGRIYLAEAFLSNKLHKTSHADDAQLILDRFADTNTAICDADTEPLLSIIDGVPPVRVFSL
jgi:hypothetical protein